jgi:hypothetical protein
MLNFSSAVDLGRVEKSKSDAIQYSRVWRIAQAMNGVVYLESSYAGCGFVPTFAGFINLIKLVSEEEQ